MQISNILYNRRRLLNNDDNGMHFIMRLDNFTFMKLSNIHISDVQEYQNMIQYLHKKFKIQQLIIYTTELISYKDNSYYENVFVLSAQPDKKLINIDTKGTMQIVKQPIVLDITRVNLRKTKHNTGNVVISYAKQ